jgi:hypothetical protein
MLFYPRLGVVDSYLDWRIAFAAAGGNANNLSRAREYQIGAYGCVRYRSFRRVKGLTIPGNAPWEAPQRSRGSKWSSSARGRTRTRP